jgi:hypothetical protein
VPIWTLWRKRLFLCPGIEPGIVGCPARSVVTTPTALSRFLYVAVYCRLRLVTQSCLCPSVSASKMYVYVCVCFYVRVYVCFCVYMCAYVYVCVYICVFVLIYFYVCVCVCMFMDVFMCVYVCVVCICMCICMSVCVIMYVLVYVCVCVCVCYLSFGYSVPLPCVQYHYQNLGYLPCTVPCAGAAQQI